MVILITVIYYSKGCKAQSANEKGTWGEIQGRAGKAHKGPLSGVMQGTLISPVKSCDNTEVYPTRKAC